MLSKISSGGSGSSSEAASVSAPISSSPSAPSIWRQSSSTSWHAARKVRRLSYVFPGAAAVCTIAVLLPLLQQVCSQLLRPGADRQQLLLLVGNVLAQPLRVRHLVGHHRCH